MGLLAALLLSSLAAVGALLVVLAEKFEPNPFLGFRVGYAMVSEEAWRKLNKTSGAALVALSAALSPLTILVEDVVAVGVAVLSLVFLTLALIIHAESIAEKTLISEPPEPGTPRKIEPLPPPPTYVALEVLAALGTAYYLAANYQNLPPTLAVHFGPNWEPDTYQPKDTFYPAATLLLLAVHLLTIALMTLGHAKPVIYHRPWLPRPALRKTTTALYTILLTVSLLVSYGLIDIIYYNICREHLPLTGHIIAAGIAIIALAVTYTLFTTIKNYKKWKKVIGGQAQSPGTI